MIRNSYHILDCNKNISNFNLLEESNLDTTQINSIKEELEEYHKNNSFEIKDTNNNISNQKIINNKFIFKKGYFFCSYLYHFENNYYISKPTYEYKKNPFCPKNDFTNIVISNTVPLNLNIVGVIYFYKYLSDKDESQCKNNAFTFVQEDIIHYDNDKYVIDIIYFNLLHTNIKYNLTYIYYKTINYTELKKQTYKRTLKYNYLNYKNNDSYNRLSTVIENTIYESTKQAILNYQNTKQNQTILLNFINITEKDTESLFNILSNISKSNAISNNSDSDDINCNINVFNNYLITNNIILNTINIIQENVTELYRYINKLETEYMDIMSKLNELDNFGVILTNEDNYNKTRKIFNNIIDSRGDDSIKDVNTIYGLKPIILELIIKIDNDINTLNDTIDLLKNDIGNNIIDNNKLIDKLKSTIESYMGYEINMNSINSNISNSENKLKIFIKNKNSNINISNSKILQKYKKNTIIDNDYKIKNLKNIDMYIYSQNIKNNNNSNNFNYTVRDLFEITVSDIDNIYDYIKQIYDYLDDTRDNKQYSTLYDIFYNTQNIKYSQYTDPKNLVEHKTLVDKFCNITEDGQLTLKQQNYESIFKSLPKNDTKFITLNKNRNNILKFNSKIIKKGTENYLDVSSYFDHYINSLSLKTAHFNEIKTILTFNNLQIINCCKTYNIVKEYNKHINTTLISTKILLNTYTELKNSKKFENLSLEQQTYIREFLRINNNIFSIYNKYINLYSYNISNNFYSISIKNFDNFISAININPNIEEMEMLNIYYSLKSCFEGSETNTNILDEFIIIFYCFSISMLSEYPLQYFRFLFNLYNNNSLFNKLFSEVLHNKIYLYNENNTNYIKIVSSIDELTLSEFILKNNQYDVKNKIETIKSELIKELNKGDLTNIINKLSVIKYFITTEDNNINTIKQHTLRNKFNDVDEFFRMINKYKILNFNKDINKLIELTNNYKINQSTNNNEDIQKYCVSLEKNNVYECNVCDSSKSSVIKNLSDCPVNLPYNLDISINNHLNSNLAFEADAYRIFSYISEPKKQVIYKRGRILYGEPKLESDIYEWNINKTYKNFTLLDKTGSNEDDPIIIKTHITGNSGISKEVKNDLNIIYNNTEDFYLNNFNIKNIISQNNLTDTDFKFPNSHQLYTKKEQNYYYIYFVENDIKYFMYLNIIKSKNNYDIVWREDTYSSKKPFVKNYAKWRLVKTSDYVGNLFEDPKILYNIRSYHYFDNNEPDVIKGLVSNNNTCFKYDTLLNNYLNNNYDLINNTKFKLTGFNNNYNITPYIKYNKSIFNDLKQLQFLNYIKQQKKINTKELEDNPTGNINIYNTRISNIIGDDPQNPRISLYLIKNPENDSYLYLDVTRNIIEFIPFFENSDKNENQLSKQDFVPEEFLWIIKNSNNNDILIKNKISKLSSKYNSMVSDSINNLSKNIKSKTTKKKIDKLITTINNKTSQTGGSLLKINSDNIRDINMLIKNLNYIKYNDYILLLKQLNLIKTNSKQVLQSNLFYEDVNNRALLSYLDYSTKTKQNIFIYFNYDDSRFTANLSDILNITNLKFNLKRVVNNNPLNKSDMEISIDNTELSITNNINITPGLDNTYDTIEITIPSSMNNNISQMFIYINEFEFIINIKKADVIVYYNKNPIYNKLEKYTIKNTNLNQTFNIFNNLNIGKANKTVYDFSIKLLADEEKITSQIYTLNKNIILENLLTYNNIVNEFYVKKNKLIDNTQYNSKIFYVSNDRNILYINLFSENTDDFIYSVPCKYRNNIENEDKNKIYNYICYSIYNHILLLKTKNKLNIVNTIFNLITILYKNSVYNKLEDVLNKNIDNRGYTFNSNTELNLYIDNTKLNNIYNENNIEDKISIIFDRKINNKYINFDMKYSNFMLLKDLYNSILNIQFIKLDSLKNNNLQYTEFINKTKNYISYINNIKNNSNNEGIENVLSILNKENTFNIFELIKYYFMDISVDDDNTQKFINEFKLYLYNLFVSNININNYLINLFLTITHKIQNIYSLYSNTINNLLKEDNRFLDCKYKSTSIIDIMYKFVTYFIDYENNKDDVSFLEIKYGFYYKNNEDVYVNFVKKISESTTISNNIYLITFNDIIKNYNKIYPQLIQKNIKDNTLNKPYIEAYDTYIKNIQNILDELINIKYNNIKLNEKVKIRASPTTEQEQLKTYITTNNKSDIFNYKHVNLNSTIDDKNFVKGDVVLYKFKKELKTNNIYNIINLLLPKTKTNSWKIFNEFKNITMNSNNINKIINKPIQIYSILNYNELFKSDLIDSYIIQENLLLKEIHPFNNKINNKQTSNICYFKLENDSIYLHLNDYKYKITLKKLVYSNLYLIIKNINNINYYLQFKFEENFYRYSWVKEDYNLIDNIMNKLVFINIESNNISEVNSGRKDINENDMIMIEYQYKFKSMFSHLNKFINNAEGMCKLNDTYYTIHSKNYEQIIDNNNIISLLNLALSKSNSSYILKDKYSKINEIVGDSKFYLSNYECNSYMIYNSYKNIILENSNTFIELDTLGLSINDILNDIESNTKYTIKLGYNKNKDLFYELNESCSVTKNSNKFKIQNKSDNEKKAKDNTFYIYNISKEGQKNNLMNQYKKQFGITETILEDDMIFYIIPINPVNKKIIQTKKVGVIEDTGLSLIPINQHSEYYLISNKKNEYLYADNLIDYKKPLRVSLKFVQTNKINMNYLWYIKSNVEDISEINTKNNSSMCMVGGQKLILNKDIKNEYLTSINEEYLTSGSSRYNDLCNNNTYVNFINYNMIETQDDVSYIDCRNKCMDDDKCKGFSYSKINNQNKCHLYDNEGLTNNDVEKKNISMLYYDCDKSLTKNNKIGEIKKTETYNTIDLINNNLYYIKCKNDDDSKNYIEFNKNNSVYHEKHYITCNSLSDKQDLYSNNIFKLKIDKNTFNSGNIKLFSLLSENKNILGTYKNKNSNNLKNVINITYDKNEDKYVWEHIDNNKWYLEPTNNMYEYTVVEGNLEKTLNDKGEVISVICEPNKYCCPFYYEGYKTLKINIDDNSRIVSVIGPGEEVYTKMYNDEDISIFKKIKNLDTIDNSVDYEGNIFIIKNTQENEYYNIFSIFNDEKYYIYKDTDNFIKFNKITNNDDLNTDKYLWSFEIYNNEISNGYSYQKIVVGGDDTNIDSPYIDPNTINMSENKNEQVGGVKKKDLINNNLYYIKSNNNKYLCANKNYKFKNNNKSTSIAISINSLLATNPNKIKKYDNKFVRASIDLSDTEYSIFKKYRIDDDILWKLEKGSDNTYKFYNVKNKVYLSVNNESLSINIIEDTSALLYYNLQQDNNLLSIGEEETDTLINNLELVDMGNISGKQVLWTFIKPTTSSKNPYMIDSEFKKLENGKIYRIINEGVKNYENTNTYLTVNETKNELLIPYNEKLFTSNLNDDPTLWKCIINDDNTYSFICMYNNYKLGNLNNQYSLLKNVGNKLNFKDKEISIDTQYLTDKFYIQHNSDEYYNIINSKNLNYYVCGFSNDNNSYDNYNFENIKYTHKVANNSNWLLTCKLEEEFSDRNTFSNEPNYYLYGNKVNDLKYSSSNTYNDMYNTIYYEDSSLNTNENKINKVIKKYKNSFKKHNSFTLSTNINCNPNENNELNQYQKDYICIIFKTSKSFYTIRLINYKNNSLLTRITCHDFKVEQISKHIKEMEIHTQLFNKLDYTKNRDNSKDINLRICAPDIYTEENIFKVSNFDINVTYDNEFLNIYINNKLISYTRISNTLFDDIYFSSNNETQWNNILWYKHKDLLDTPIWVTENIDNFKNGKPGIKFTSKINNKITFNATIEQKTLGYFYIKDVNNNYLSIKDKKNNIYDVEFINTLPSNDTNCLWKLYDTNINKNYKIKISENKKSVFDQFVLNKNDIKKATNLEDDYIDNIYNSTNIMLKTRFNKTSKTIDNVSNYEYSIIDINNHDDVNEKLCSWLHNKNGHISIDYNSDLSGTHFTTDIWNLNYITGKDIKKKNRFLVKYKNNQGIVEIDSSVNINYTEYGLVGTTSRARWNNFEEIKNFNSIKSQNNIYVEEIKNNKGDFNNVCITLNDDSASAYCSQVEQSRDCDENNSVLFIPNEKCENVLYKNYKLLRGEKLVGGNISGGSVWIESKYFYLNDKTIDGDIIFNNINNVKYIPEFDTEDKEVLKMWTYDDIDSKNNIYSKIYNNYDYDGYIEDKEKKIIRAVILPNNFILFTHSRFEKSKYIEGRMKSYNIEYKNVKVITPEEYFSNYNNKYITIETKIGSSKVNNNDLLSINYKLNKCYDFIKNNICIPIGNNKTRMAKNVSNIDFLIKNFDEFKNEENNFRIVNIYGKYLSDLYVNNTYLCNKDNINVNEIVLQGQHDFVNFKKNSVHTMHSTSQESLWKMIHKNENGKDTYRIINSYTNKLLNDKNNGQKDFIIEYVDNKYFKQQLVNDSNSQLIYNNEDIYYIYYIEKSVNYYLSYEDVLIDNEYRKTSLIKFSEDPQPFIIKKATYNLDILTDEFNQLPSDITNICYNKTNTCNEISNIDLISNIKNNCLDIKFYLQQIFNIGGITTSKKINIDNFYSLLVKNDDNFYTTPTAGVFELVFNIKDINVNTIVYSFSTVIEENDDLQIEIQAKINNEESIIIIKEETPIPKNIKIVEYTETLPESVLNSLDVEIKLIMKSNDRTIKLNYVEFTGNPQKNTYKRSDIITNSVTNNYKTVKINKSFISKKNNIDNNLIKIKYINNNANQSINNDLESNILNYIDNTNKLVISDSKNNIDTFLVKFNPLLNCYMFYIKDNKYLNINIPNKNNYINGYYFKLVESETFPLSFDYKLFNIQCYDNKNLYLNINSNNEIELGVIKHDFVFINTNINDTTKLLNYNNYINNNILYDFYIKCVYISGVDSSNLYYHIVGNNDLRTDNIEKTKLLLQKIDINKYSLTSLLNNNSIIINNLINLNNNTYEFMVENNGESHKVIIKLTNNYDNLKLYTYDSYKKHSSFNDINKTIESTKLHTETVKRNSRYLTHNLVLKNIILNNIITFQNNGLYIISDSDNKLIEKDILDDNGYFVEIKIGNSNLYKIWNVKFKKFIKFDIINNLFVLDDNVIEYNDIDKLNDIDIVHIFERIEDTINNNYYYTLYYATSETYLNVVNINMIKHYIIEEITDIRTFDYYNYDDYCSKMCDNNSNIENKLMNTKIYNIQESASQLNITLGEYTISILGNHELYKKYFNINVTYTNQGEDKPIESFKEYNILKNIFGNDTKNLNVTIVTVNISKTEEEILYNIIIWNDSKITYGRFENEFDIPKVDKSKLPIIYDSSYNKLEFNNNKNYIFTSYKEPPLNKKYIQLNKFNLDIINKFKISIYHIDNLIEDSFSISKSDNNKLSNIRKLYTTCSWGDCSEYEDISGEDISKISKNLERFERVNKLSGGMLDINMIRFLKHMDNDNIDYYKNSDSVKYVYNNSTFFENNKLNNILFKKNDVVEIHKIFGLKGWTNSFNSLYNKNTFMISGSNIKEADYYDTFRNIYPISLLQEKYAFNSENLWKQNIWFEDSPHFRSLPLWKFEEIQIGENNSSSSSNNIESLEIIGGKSKIVKRKKNNNSQMLNKILYISILIIVIYYLYKILIQ